MDIYCITGYCTNHESGFICQVNEIYATRDKAEEVFHDYINETRSYAEIAETMKGVGNSNGTWTECISEIHGSRRVLSRYECFVSLDLTNDDCFEMFKRMSAIGLIEDREEMSIAHGIRLDRMYSALSFKIANLKLEVKNL